MIAMEVDDDCVLEVEKDFYVKQMTPIKPNAEDPELKGRRINLVYSK